MRRRFRFVRVLKWAGAVVCLLILAAFIASAWYEIVGSPDSRVCVGVDCGSLYALYDFDVSPIMSWHRAPKGRAHEFRLAWAGFSRDMWSPRSGGAEVPLWLPFLIALGPTLVLWRLDRRVPPGHCSKCHYNLTGNTTDRCPECGTSLAATAR